MAIRTPGGRQLEVTADDRLWLARAVAREGEPLDLVAQALVNRWAWLADAQPGTYPRLQDLVRAYAQPVNPRWMPGGDLFERRLERLRATGQTARIDVERRRAARRVRYAQATQFSPAVLDAVRQAVMGPVTLPAGVQHYHARPGRPFPEVVRGVPGQSNTFYRAPGDAAREALYSVVTPARVGRVVGALVAVGIGALLAWRRFSG